MILCVDGQVEESTVCSTCEFPYLSVHSLPVPAQWSRHVDIFLLLRVSFLIPAWAESLHQAQQQVALDLANLEDSGLLEKTLRPCRTSQ